MLQEVIQYKLTMANRTVQISPSMNTEDISGVSVENAGFS